MSHAVLHTRSCAGRCLRSFLAPLQPSAAVRRVITACNDRLRAVETTTSTESAGWSEQEQLTSITVDIGQSLERVSVPLRVLGAQLVVVRLQFPLGLVLENVGGEAVVTNISPGGAAEGAGIELGDVLRATSATTMAMTYPTLNLMFGGVGRPKLTVVLVPTAALPFQRILDAVRSNSAASGGDDSISLVLERAPLAGSGSAASSRSGSASSDTGSAERQQQQQQIGGDRSVGGGVFDPALFD